MKAGETETLKTPILQSLQFPLKHGLGLTAGRSNPPNVLEFTYIIHSPTRERPHATILSYEMVTMDRVGSYSILFLNRRLLMVRSIVPMRARAAS